MDQALLLPAVERLVGTPGGSSRAQAERFLGYAVEQKIDVQRMFTEVDGRNRPIRTVLLVPNPGRTAVAFAGPAPSRLNIPALGGLIEHACQQLDPADIHLAQALLEPADSGLGSAFRSGGFTELAQLAYLERPLPRGPLSVPPWPDDVRITGWEPERRADVLRILKQSYEGTLDCPGLRGLRELDDILEGHMKAGVFEPGLWRVLYLGDEPAGVTMLNTAPGSASIELVYLGLAPVARGRGFGASMLRDAINGLVGRTEHSITLAVDLRNHPALSLYRGLDFRRKLRRTAFIRSLRAST
ncbi:MAG: GNAT family N-acetyltransferase [Phycisphaerales bacterium]